MTDPRRLLGVEASAPLLMFQATAKAAAEAVYGWRDAGLAVRVVRGRKMRTVPELFDETAAALQFPLYFGENWAAFGECLSDLDQLAPAGLVVLVVEPAEVLSAADASQLDVLVRSIAAASDTYAKPIDSGEWWDRPAVPFHVVLQSLPADADRVRERWRAAGATLADLESP